MKGETMNEDLINLDDYVIVAENGESIGAPVDFTTTTTTNPDDDRIRAIVRQAYNDTIDSFRDAGIASDVPLSVDQFDLFGDIFLFKCGQRLNRDDYAAVYDWWQDEIRQHK